MIHPASKNTVFSRVAALSPQVTPANTQANIQAILDAAGTQPDANIYLTPEMSLCGYTCQDLFLQEHLIEQCLAGLNTLMMEFRRSAILIVGMPVRVGSKVCNCACVIKGNPIGGAKLLGIIPKTWLPNYSEFYEMRWFASSLDCTETEVDLGHEFGVVPFGTDLIFRDSNSGLAFGVEICEDLWAVTPPSNRLALAGAHLICNLSASNELVGKADYRRELVKTQSGRLICAYAYASASTGESVSDTVFSGHCLIADNNRILVENKRLQPQSSIAADICITEIEGERNRNSTFRKQTVQPCRRVDFDLDRKVRTNLLKSCSPTPFIPDDEARRDTVCEEIAGIQTAALGRRLSHLGYPPVVIGVSGGLDSTLALLIAHMTFSQVGLPTDRIIAMTLPGMGTSDHTRSNAEALMCGLGVTSETHSIVAMAEAELRTLGHTTHDVTFENVQARARTALLFNRANQVKGLVLGTGDLSELALGWMTYCGDSESHYHINAGIPKTLIRVLVEWLGRQPIFHMVRPSIESIIHTPISPELLPLGAGGEIVQQTEDSIGPYILHDFFLYWAIRKQMPPRYVLCLAKHAFPDYDFSIIRKWLKVFYSRFASQQFKRNSMPDGLKVGTMSLSPRSDLRMPSEASIQTWIDEVDAFEE